MSFGKKSTAYQPISHEMLPTISRHFNHISAQSMEEIFSIMTRNLYTETLLFVSIVDMIDRFNAGKRDKSAFGLGTGVLLSAVAHDKSHKAQTHLMELLHDVFVELPMAGANFEQLQCWLRNNLGAEVVMYHSCGSAIVPVCQKKEFFDRAASAQEMRTRLDWEAETLKEVSEQTLLAKYEYSEEEARNAQRCLTIAMEAMVSAPYKAKVPKSLELTAA